DDLPGRRSADPLAGAPSAASSVRVVEIAGAEGRTPHRHPHSEEIIHVVEGAGWVWLDGATYPVRQGDTVHVPAGMAHATITGSGDRLRLVCFFPHPDLDSNLEELTLPLTREEP
ncbi:MAG: cupin domain-containing protein, partial [Acidimicrobiia bacterium]